MAARREHALRIMKRVASLPPAEALRYNSWLRDFAYLERAEISAGYPAIFEIEPTNMCAMRCTHCPRQVELHREGLHMSPMLLRGIAPQIRRYAQNLYAAGNYPARKKMRPGVKSS